MQLQRALLSDWPHRVSAEMLFSRAYEIMQIYYTAYATQPLQYPHAKEYMQHSPWCVQWLLPLITGSTQMPFVYQIPGTLEGYFFQFFLMQANLGLWSLTYKWKDLLVLQGQEKTEKRLKILLEYGQFLNLVPRLLWDLSKNKEFDSQPYSSQTGVCLTCTLHISVMSSAPLFLLPGAQNVFPNFWSCSG